ncbi:MAG TPA: LysM peptidoglycan-binding domain-containing protein [Acidobacteriaceae bacterium]|nr:LysM peptidoglycan-binding domain-containing protein [Acidobacteriaceae bacterium]
MVVSRALFTLAFAALLPIAATSAASAQSPPPAASQSSAQTESAQQRRVEQVIKDVEAAYQNGLSNYQQGHLAAAKSNFDYAVDQMLSCGIDIKSTPELDTEFEHIVDAVNNIEMDALKQGNGLAPAPEPTPVGVANDVTFPVDPTIRAEAEAQLKTTHSDLPLVMNDYVASYINFFSKSQKGHATIVDTLNRLGRYKALIESILRQQGVPQDLIYQAAAESGFRPQAVNPRSGAGGMWQFMPGDAYAPPRSAWFDERFDPVASTIAYAHYMKDLYKQFGDWYLAMAAYDWGAGNIQRAVQHTGYADFWELYKRNNLPAETKNYVPIILAVTIMAKNPGQYGLNDLTPDPPLLDDTVQTDYSVGLPLVADLVGAPLQEIAGLNPSLLRGATPPDQTFDLHLPAGTKQLFEQRIAQIPVDKRRYWRYHTIAPGDTLAGIARTYHVSVSDITEVNQLASTTDLSGVDGIIVPVAPRYEPSSTTLYRVRHGDTLITIADRFGVTVTELRRWNHIPGYFVRTGRRIYVAEPVHVHFRSRRRHHYYHSRRSSHPAAAHHSRATTSRRTTSHPRKSTSSSHKNT